MNCQEALDLLYEIIDKEASEIDESEVREHLKKCGHCSEIYRLESSLQEFLGAKVDKSKPAQKVESLRLKVLAELDSIDRNESDCDSKPRLRGPLLFVVAAAALIILVGASFFTSDLVRHYKEYGPLERAHFAAVIKDNDPGNIDKTVAELQNSYSLYPKLSIDGLDLTSAHTEEVKGVEMPHLLYSDNGNSVSVFVAPYDKFEIPADLKDKKVIQGDFEFYDHTCRGCRLVYVISGSAVIVVASEARGRELLSFVPGHAVI